jgi:hypothetical protein
MWGVTVGCVMGVAMIVMMTFTMRVLMAMAMPMPTISTPLWFKRFLHLHHRHVHGAQHVGQHMVGFDFQMVGLQLDGHMAVAQVIRRACQIKW